ncbi:alcohol dehydrogenase-like protein [Diplodia corticola]|uniref:Alcohol dehydrogenase-like protein n=1 Tax=Diplodia corticola TaxID=236234 RepID=A0A1J9SLB2_9PEZI|nr:alcohol dehydrogenase-like protein [Diplodia corticola]OJD40508.1 alcohol dehydrogenase-like protein [Diplodia corticola]
MAVSTISSTLPLFDRSNTPLDSFVSSHRSPPTWRQAPSKRQLFPQLDSSEATPSESGSIYDAKQVSSESEADEPPQNRPRSKKRPHYRSLPEEEWAPSAIPNGFGVAVRFINRPDATPLTTIIEQKSIATLRSARLRAEKTEQKQPSRRQAALTIDEATLRELHEIMENQRPPDHKISSGSGSTNVDDVGYPARPISPQHSPPFRAQTPSGLPRWPGDSPGSLRSPRRRASGGRGFRYALRHMLRRPPGGESE